MRKGVTLIELVTVMAVIGIVSATALPRMHASPERLVKSQAYQLVNDLEVARTKAIATKSQVRLVFNVSGGSYSGYLDDDHDGTVNETNTERSALQGFGVRTLDGGVTFGVGSASAITAVPGTPPVTFPNSRLDFSSRGITTPFGTRGAVYVVSRDDPNVVAAVTVSGAGSFKVFVYRNGSWQ